MTGHVPEIVGHDAETTGHALRNTQKLSKNWRSSPYTRGSTNSGS